MDSVWIRIAVTELELAETCPALATDPSRVRTMLGSCEEPPSCSFSTARSALSDAQ